MYQQSLSIIVNLECIHACMWQNSVSHEIDNCLHLFCDNAQNLWLLQLKPHAYCSVIYTVKKRNVDYIILAINIYYFLIECNDSLHVKLFIRIAM